MTGRRARLLVAAVVLVPLLAYPLAVVAQGRPSFPGDRGECARAAADDGGPVEVVAAHLASFDAARALRARVAAAGLVSAAVEQDGCGRWKVVREGIGSYAEGRATVDALLQAGFGARLELDPSTAAAS